MDYNVQSTLFLGAFFFFASCATSMSPAQVYDTLPSLTKSEFYSQPEAEEAVKSNKCEYLVNGRSYSAPMGLTVKADLKYGARGIDEWVELDGGNAYSLTRYIWETVDDFGSTQLKLEFDTLVCE